MLLLGKHDRKTAFDFVRLHLESHLDFPCGKPVFFFPQKNFSLDFAPKREELFHKSDMKNRLFFGKKSCIFKVYPL